MNRMIGVFLFAFLIVPCGFAKSASSVRKEFERFESVVLPHTQVRKIHSEFTKHNYRIYVSIPASYYDEPNKKYEALFTLDADYSFALAKQITEHLSDRNRIPELFVFSIAYDGPLNYRVNRTRDYTPTFVADGGYGPEFQKHSGGGPAFASFLEKELIPYLEKNFRLTNQRTIVGHSYGGLFASWMLVAKPDVFDNYIALSPSLWYDDKLVLKLDRQIASSSKSKSGRAFFGVGSKEAPAYGTTFDLVKDMEQFAGALKRRGSNNMQIGSHVFEGENHDTVFAGALTRGIMFVFGDSKS